MAVASNYAFSALNFPGQADGGIHFGDHTDTIAVGIAESGHILGRFDVKAFVSPVPMVSLPYESAGTFILRDGEYDRTSGGAFISGSSLPYKYLDRGNAIDNYDNVAVGYSTAYPIFPQFVGTGINDAGKVVGGNVIERNPGDISVSAQTQDINNLDQVSYNLDGHGFIKDGASTTQIDFPGATATTIYGINDVGQAVGTYTDATGTHGFVETRGLFAELKLPDGSDVSPYGINNLGQIVGGYKDAAGTHGFLANEITPPGQGTLVLRVSGDEWTYHPGAQFVVLVDGAQVGGVQNVMADHAAGQVQEITLPTNVTSAQTVAVQFLNDQYGGAGQDVNLHIDSLVFNGVEHTGGQAAIGSSYAVREGTGVELFNNGTATFSVAQSTLSLKVAEDAFQGDAQFIVMVDGRTVGGVQTAHASHAAGQFETINLQGDFNGAQTVGVQFINDAYKATGQDRNLYIESVSVNGVTATGHDATVSSNAGQATDEVLLYRDTIATFSLGNAHHDVLMV